MRHLQHPLQCQGTSWRKRRVGIKAIGGVKHCGELSSRFLHSWALCNCSHQYMDVWDSRSINSFSWVGEKRGHGATSLSENVSVLSNCWKKKNAFFNNIAADERSVLLQITPHPLSPDCASTLRYQALCRALNERNKALAGGWVRVISQSGLVSSIRGEGLLQDGFQCYSSPLSEESETVLSDDIPWNSSSLYLWVTRTIYSLGISTRVYIIA